MQTARKRARRARRVKLDAEIVLLCNPRAGGRWKELAAILDSDEARSVRRIVTDSVEDIAEAVGELGYNAKLICIYGGDGTIQRVLDRLHDNRDNHAHLALLGGGTMNVTSRWCGFSRKPAVNFRHVVRSYRNGDLLYKEVPVLDVRSGEEFHRGFTFGMGPVVRLLDAYERGKKGKLRALGTAALALSAVWVKHPGHFDELLELMDAEVQVDGEPLPYDRWAALFANVTGQINPGIEPFRADQRGRDSFYYAACAVSARELTLALPMLARGWLPVDLAALFSYSRLTERLRDPSALLSDARYVNRTGARMIVRAPESIYTVDGEILPVQDGQVTVDVGPQLRLAAGPLAGVKQTIHHVAGRVSRR